MDETGEARRAAALAGAVLEHFEAAAAVVSPEGAIVCANGAFGRLTGAAAARLADARLETVLPALAPDEHAALRRVALDGQTARAEAALGCGARAELEWRPLDLDDAGGRHVLIRIRPAPERDPGREAIDLDVTGLKEREAALATAEARIRDVLASASDWVWESDADLRFTYLSERFTELTGIRAEDVLGRTREEVCGADLDDPAWQAHRAELHARQPFRDRVFHTGQGAGRRYFRVSGVPVFADGVFTGYRGAASEITAQKRVEEQLRESEARFRDIAQAASDWIWEMDESLNFTFISDRLREVTGVGPEEFIGRPRGHLATRNNDQQAWRRHLDDLEHRRPFRHFRYAYAGSDGREHHAVISGVPVFDAGGTFRGYRGTGTDVTGQVEAERAARDQQALLVQAVEALAHGFAVFDDRDRLLLCNASYYRPLGFGRLAPGTPFAAIVAKAIRLGLRSSRHPDPEALAQDFMARHRRADGVPAEFSLANGRWISSSKSRLANGFRVAVQVDITEMKRREQALKDSETRFRQLADAAFEGILVHDDRRIIDTNQAFLELTGYGTRELILGRPLGDFFEGAGDLDLGAERGVLEVMLKRRDGSAIVVEAQGKTVPYQGRSVQVVAMRDISERRRAEARIRHLAHHDALTGLPNRALYRDRLHAALAERRRDGRRAAVMQLDLDDFKDVNDTLGHPAGDAFLCEVARRLRACVRASDTVARVGGDEFAVLLTGLVRGSDAAAMARRILERLRAPIHYQGHTLYPRASIGVTIFPDDDRDPEQLLKNADIALYRAKSGGRNTYSFFVSSMKREVELRRTLENELRIALEARQFRMSYQPQVELATGRVVGIEALLRWQHPERGLLAPNAFLRVAEDTGLIVPIGRLVMREACREARRWLDQGLDFGRIAINVAPAQFKMGRLVATVREILSEVGLGPDRLELEITEGVFLGRGSEGVTDTLRRLTGMNIRIALDDFGTGYASLAHLKRLPIDRLKIDRSFIRDIGADPEDAAIVRTVLSLGHALGLEVVAEGVETVDQHRFLLRHGCRIAQGYLFSRPLSALETKLFLEAGGDFGIEDADAVLAERSA